MLQRTKSHDGNFSAFRPHCLDNVLFIYHCVTGLQTCCKCSAHTTAPQSSAGGGYGVFIWPSCSLISGLCWRFGEAPPEDEDVACQVCRVAFYADSALEALEKLDQDRSLTPQEAAEAVVAAKEEQTRAAIAAQQQAAQAARQAAREVSAL